jgi:predicted nucleotide-binding protein
MGGLMARRPSPPRAEAAKQLTPDEIRNGIARLEKRIEELADFNPQKMTVTHPHELKALSTSIQTTLGRIFGENTPDYQRFSPAADLQWAPIIGFVIRGTAPTPLSQYIAGVANKRERSLALLREAVRTLREDLADQDQQPQPAAQPTLNLSTRKVFIVHGHDEAPRESVARFIEKLGLEAVILHERPNKGRAIITKFREEAAGIGFAVVLMTPDDLGKGKEDADLKLRPRQNVIFELGFFIGALNPERVAALVKGDIDLPSDYDGVVYISIDKEDWRTKLAKELETAHYEIDWNKVMKS